MPEKKTDTQHSSSMVVRLRESAHAISQYEPELSYVGEMYCGAAHIIEELVEALAAASEALGPAHLYSGTHEDWEEHQRDTREWIDALLTKIGYEVEE